MDPSSRPFKILLALLLIIIFISGILLTQKDRFLKTEKSIENQQANITGSLEENSMPTMDFYVAVKNDDYQTIKANAPTIVTSPNIFDANIRDKLITDKILSDQPTNNFVNIENDKLSQNFIAIKQGDLITWNNLSLKAYKIIGVDGWGSILQIKPGERYSQTFDFKGEYKYYLEDNPTVNGVIKVQ